MNFSKAPDPINSIIKTINPIHSSFSKQNKDYNKYFLSLNLDVVNFVKTLNQLDQKKSVPDIYETLYKKNETNKYVYEQDIIKTFNKLKKLKDNKYLPKSLMDKFKFKYFGMDKTDKKEKKKIVRDNDNLKYIKNKIKVNDNFYYEITLDPGRYDPKYSLIFKKIPDIYIEKEKSKRNFSLKKNINNLKQNKKLNIFKDTQDTNNSIKKLNIKGIKKSKKFISINDIDKLKKYEPKNIISSNTTTNNKNKKIFSSSMENFKPSQMLTPKFQNINLRILNKTHNSGFFPNFNKKNKIHSADLKNTNFHFESNNRNNSEEQRTLNRCESCKNSHIRVFSFAKMTGRKQKKVDIRADYRSSIYKPNYEIVTPKYIRRKTKLEKFQNFKRYAVGKIIRNYYCFSPSDYFIFDINKNNRTFDKNYINKINIKYNI